MTSTRFPTWVTIATPRSLRCAIVGALLLGAARDANADYATIPSTQLDAECTEDAARSDGRLALRCGDARTIADDLQGALRFHRLAIDAPFQETPELRALALTRAADDGIALRRYSEVEQLLATHPTLDNGGRLKTVRKFRNADRAAGLAGLYLMLFVGGAFVLRWRAPSVGALAGKTNRVLLGVALVGLWIAGSTAALVGAFSEDASRAPFFVLAGAVPGAFLAGASYARSAPTRRFAPVGAALAVLAVAILTVARDRTWLAAFLP